MFDYTLNFSSTPTFDKVTTGNTVTDGNGVTISKAGASPVSLTSDGLNNGGNTITNTNVASGGDTDSNAANIGDVKKAAAAAKNTVSAGDSNVLVTPKTHADGHTDYAVTLDGTKAQVKAGSVVVDGKAGTVTGLGNKTWVSGSPQPVSGRAATEDQFKAVDNQVAQNKTDIANLSGNIGKGLNFAGNTGSTNKKLGQTVNIVGEGKKDDSRYSGENIKTMVDAQGNLVVKTDKDLKAESLTVGKDGQTGLTLSADNGAGQIAVNGKDGDNLASDGAIAKKLNRRLDIVGGADKNKLSDNNIGVNKDGQGHLKVQLAKELNGLTSAFYTDGSGNTNTVNGAGHAVRDSAGNQTAVNAGGVTVTPSGAGKAPVSLTAGGLDNGGNQISNVAAGTKATDAVNVGQLNAKLGALTNAANLNFNALERKINDIGDNANAGVAGAIAQGSIPQVTRPGASGIGVGSGYYGGQFALAVGMSSMSDGGNWIVKGNVSVNTRGRVGAGAGALYQW